MISLKELKQLAELMESSGSLVTVKSTQVIQLIESLELAEKLMWRLDDYTVHTTKCNEVGYNKCVCGLSDLRKEFRQIKDKVGLDVE